MLFWVVSGAAVLGAQKMQFCSWPLNYTQCVFFGHYVSESSEEGTFIAYNFKDKGLKIFLLSDLTGDFWRFFMLQVNKSDSTCKNYYYSL